MCEQSINMLASLTARTMRLPASIRVRHPWQPSATLLCAGCSEVDLIHAECAINPSTISGRSMSGMEPSVEADGKRTFCPGDFDFRHCAGETIFVGCRAMGHGTRHIRHHFFFCERLD